MARLRFIAGAVCPQCGEMDRLVIEPSVDAAAEDVDRRRCVNCGYSDERPGPASREPRSRLDGGLKRAGDDPDTPITPVRIID